MTEAATPLDLALRRIQELEARLEESEETLDAIRRGDIDAVVISGGEAAEHHVYTLENADHPYRVLIEQIQEGAVTIDGAGTVFYGNRRLASMLGIPQERIIGQNLQWFMLPQDQPAFEALLARADRGGTRAELTLLSAEGVQTAVYLSLNLLQAQDGIRLLCGVMTDLTEQKLHLRAMSEANTKLIAESAQRMAAEEALRQSHKMEAVGQLTGGLAHDFNNLLTGIAGSLELLGTRLAQGRFAELPRYIAAAEGACKRAAALTHRLLAFSRRQTLDPKPIDVNRLVADMEEMVRHSAGPQVAVAVKPQPGLWSTLVDPNQLENALLNLCINARDAMPNGGRLTIETANHSLDAEAAAARDVAPGEYISLGVSDTGTGMAPEVIARAFDPFFTTKPIGKGTGLGLSMIYGFARQSGGQARIDSELGRGSSIRLYLPRHRADAEVPPRQDVLAPRGGPGRGETVLIVDDEPTVRMLVTDVLEELGYQTLEASDGAVGLRIVQSPARIDLLITDVGLPGALNGRQLADAARAGRPGLTVLFITGYAENAQLGGGDLEPGMHVLTKPFAIELLVQRIQELIAAPT